MTQKSLEHLRAWMQNRQQLCGTQQQYSLTALTDLGKDGFLDVISRAVAVKSAPSDYASVLEGRSAALLFRKTSTRTRCSFEVGIAEMGGHPMYIDWRTSNFMLADLRDEIRSLGRYVDFIMARVQSHDEILTMVDYSPVPVISGMCDTFHPCQALADFMTIQECFGGLDGIRMAYVGDGNNVSHSLINGCALAGIELNIACPVGYEPNQDIVDRALELTKVTMHSDARDAVKNADVVYTDTWVSIGQENEAASRKSALSDFQVDMELMNHAESHAIFMHCLPAHRGDEVTDEVMDSPNSVVFDQAENRKHAQKGLLIRLAELKGWA